MHSSLPVAVVSVIMRSNKILLLKRKNTPWMNWYWWLPGGRLDTWESMTHGAVRELEEETWIKIKENDISFKWVVHHKDDRWERIYFVISTENPVWTLENKEVDKCEQIEWFDTSNLPNKITPQVSICLNIVNKNITFSEYWYS